MALSTLEKIAFAGAAIPAAYSLFRDSGRGSTPQSTSQALGDEAAFRAVGLDALRNIGTEAQSRAAPTSVARRLSARESAIGRQRGAAEARQDIARRAIPVITEPVDTTGLVEGVEYRQKERNRILDQTFGRRGILGSGLHRGGLEESYVQTNLGIADIERTAAEENRLRRLAGILAENDIQTQEDVLANLDLLAGTLPEQDFNDYILPLLSAQVNAPVSYGAAQLNQLARNAENAAASGDRQAAANALGQLAQAYAYYDKIGGTPTFPGRTGTGTLGTGGAGAAGTAASTGGALGAGIAGPTAFTPSDFTLPADYGLSTFNLGGAQAGATYGEIAPAPYSTGGPSLSTTGYTAGNLATAQALENAGVIVSDAAAFAPVLGAAAPFAAIAALPAIAEGLNPNNPTTYPTIIADNIQSLLGNDALGVVGAGINLNNNTTQINTGRLRSNIENWISSGATGNPQNPYGISPAQRQQALKEFRALAKQDPSDLGLIRAAQQVKRKYIGKTDPFGVPLSESTYYENG